MLCLGRPRPNATANVDAFCSGAARPAGSRALALLAAAAVAAALLLA
jgi:hypothetical protein